ncbi:MAG: hypothetical protein AB3X44_14895 [Leptothrix sp. (in: b-proteobacteria)]
MRTAAVFFSGVALSGLSAWLVLHWPTDPLATRASRLGLWCLTLWLIRQAWLDTRPQVWWLAWTGQHWALQTPDAALHDAWPGTLQVRLDLGRWLLLEFMPLDTCAPRWHHQRPSIWLSASRRALPDQWHALRCAVYSPRPASLVALADGSPAANPPPHEHRP